MRLCPSVTGQKKLLGCALFTETSISFSLTPSSNLTQKGSTPMPHRFQISRDSQALFITLNTKNRLPVFRKDEITRVLCDAIDEARKSAGLLLFAYVIMIDHLHLITDQPKPISEVLRVLKLIISGPARGSGNDVRLMMNRC
jgi:Transposase IS200 like